MRRLALASLLLLAGLAVLSASSAPTRAEEQKGRVLLVSLDGLRPEIYRDAKYRMPNLRALAARGVQARKVVGIFPTLT